jgi:hypothetical protein
VIFDEIKNEIQRRCAMITNKKELSTINKPLLEAQKQIDDPDFRRRLIFVHDNMQPKNRFLQLQEIRTILQYVGKKFNVETGRCLQKYKETQVLALAVYFNSWWPFLNSAQRQSTNSLGDTHARNIILDIKEGTQYLDKNNNLVHLNAAIKVSIPVGKHKEAVEIPKSTEKIPIIEDITYPCESPKFDDDIFGEFFADSSSLWN